MSFSIQRELQGMTDEQRASCEHHFEHLNEILRATSPHSVRDDSRLALRYASGQLPFWSPYTVAHEMSCTQYLCDAYDYQAALPGYLRALADEAKAERGDRVTWTQVWAAVSDIGPELFKIQALLSHGHILPDFAPLGPPAAE